MNYVDHMNIFDVDYKEIPCIKGDGTPTTSTEGAVGMLYMDKLTGSIYKCTSASNSKYVWNLMIDDKTTVKEAYLGWGGKDITASVSPLDAALIAEMSANRLAYMPAEDIEIEYSRDGGVTWVNYDDFHNDDKIRLVTQGSKNLMIGGTNSGVTTDYMSRVTISANSIYFQLRKAAIHVNTNGSGNAKAKVELFYNGDTDFRAYKEVPVAGWTAWNIIQFDGFAFGSTSSNNVKKVRFTFSIGTTNSAYTNAFSITKLYMYGETQWGVASNLAGSGTIYGIDYQQNVTFPAKVTATGGFSGNLTGNATTATTATQAAKDGNGNYIDTYYMKRGTYERIEGTSAAHKNLNDYTTAGFYNVKTLYTDNCPEGIGIDAALLVYPWNSTGYELQEITETAASTSMRRWVRKNNNGTWSEWKQITSEDDVNSMVGDKMTLSTSCDAVNIESRVIKNFIDYDASLWEYGSLSAGSNFNDGISIRVRSVGYFELEQYTDYKVSIKSGYKVGIHLYYNEQFGYMANNATYLYDGDVFNTNQCNSMRVLIAEESNADLSLSCAEECELRVENGDESTTTTSVSLRQGYKNPIKIMTFNVGQFYNGVSKCPDDYVETHKATFKQLFKKYQPDFIFTQESPHYGNVGETVEGKTFFDNRYVNYVGTTNWLGKQFITNHNLFGYSQHDFSNERDYVKAYTYINEIKVALYNAHLSLTPELRAVQIAELIADMQTEEYVILGFDSNIATVDELHPFVNAGYKLGNAGVLGDISTYVNSNRFLDNVIVSSNITLCKAEAETELFEEFEDHRPFILTIEIGANTVDEPAEDGTYDVSLTVKDGVKSYNFINVTPDITLSIDTSWTADTTNGGYTKTVAVSGILATDTPFVDVVLGDNIETNATALKAWNLVTRITTADGSITLYANGDAPTTAFDIQLKVVR